MIRNLCVVLCTAIAIQLSAQIDILVVDTSQTPLVGAVVTLDDQVSTTDVDGLCRFPASGTRLTVQYLGHESYSADIAGQTGGRYLVTLAAKIFDLTGVELLGSWIEEDEPFAYDVVREEELEKSNVGQDVPYLLQWLPSAVVTSDAGTGIGYTGYRIRGSDPTRINVTIDGIPLNDSESQGVFWVDLPDFASSVEAIQVQRGVGASTNGAGAFGGTISLKTKGFSETAYTKLEGGLGSFGTQRGSFRMGTGRIGKYFSVEGRGSMIESDGYIDRASASLRSLFGSVKYLRDRTSVTFNLFTGKEVTYQAWNGVPAQWIGDSELRNSNTAGVRGDGSFHPNEVDDYTQTHAHLTLRQQFSENVYAHVGLHYTRGFGFFEQYRIGDDLADYGINAENESDLIRRRWLDNHFAGMVFTLSGSPSTSRMDWQIGGGYNAYLGDHFGEVIWSRIAADTEKGHEYYRNDATKQDGNIYVRSNLYFDHDLSAFADLQYRRIDYNFAGFNADLQPAEQAVSHNFVNPKVGVMWRPSATEVFYSLAVGHREPSRDDYTNSTPLSRPKAEVLFDHEAGIRHSSSGWLLGANLYYMRYRDQLVLTGELNDVGEAIRQNVDDSYRLGIEFNASVALSKRLRLSSNLALSRNRIQAFTEFIDDWDTGMQIEVEHLDSDIAFSPDVVGYAQLEYDLWTNPKSVGQVLWHHKYVSRQYLDNTSNLETSLDPYYFSDLEMRVNLSPKWASNVSLKFQLRNIFNKEYSSNGWTYRYASQGYDGRQDDPHTRLQSDGYYNLTGFYPQALRNVLMGIVLDF